MTHRVLKKLKAAIIKYSEVRKTIPCTHPPNHHNCSVATWQLWDTSGRVHALLVLAEFSLLGDRGGGSFSLQVVLISILIDV